MGRIRKNQSKGSNDKKMIWKIGLYERLSKEDKLKASGDADQSRSIVNQDDILRDFVTDYFEEGTYEITNVFIDDGLTGTDENRPEFQKMKKYVLDKKINCVVLKSLARAFRNLGDQSKFIEEFCPRHQLRFINIGEPFIDTFHKPRSAYSMEVPFAGIMNERFAQQTSIEVRKTFDMKRKKGLFIGSFAPYGYQKDPNEKGKLVIDEEAAEIVRDIFHWFIYDGLSKMGIAKKLSQLGVPSPSEYKKLQGLNYRSPHIIEGNKNGWSPKTVHSILGNEMYIGNMVQGRQEVISYKVHDCVRVPEENWYIVEDTHEAIVDRATFQKAQSLHRLDTRTANNKKKVHLFSGFLKCADCKRALHRKTSKNNVYYFCRTFNDKGLCSKHTIRHDILEEKVLETIRNQISLVADLTEVIEGIDTPPFVRTESNRLNQGFDKSEKELLQVTETIDSLYLDLKANLLTQQDYVRLKLKLTARQEELQRVINHIKIEMETLQKGVGNDDAYLISFLEHKNITVLTRGILVELIDTIHLHENGGLTIDLNFSDQYQIMMELIRKNQAKLCFMEDTDAGQLGLAD